MSQVWFLIGMKAEAEMQISDADGFHGGCLSEEN